MPRPLTCRRILGVPGCVYYKPAGIPLMRLEEVVVSLDEYEAMRLVDLEGLYQEAAAKRMKVSRQTLGRIVESARRKVAGAFVKGMAIKLEGGHVEVLEAESVRTFICRACKRTWTAPWGTGRPTKCPHCGSGDFRREGGERGLCRRDRGGRELCRRRPGQGGGS